MDLNDILENGIPRVDKSDGLETLKKIGTELALIFNTIDVWSEFEMSFSEEVLRELVNENVLKPVLGYAEYRCGGEKHEKE
jgi:ribosomal protein S25